MTTFNLDYVLLIIIASGVALAVLYMIFEIAGWRTRRLADIKSLSNMRELYRRSFAHARKLVPLKFTKRKP